MFGVIAELSLLVLILSGMIHGIQKVLGHFGKSFPEGFAKVVSVVTGYAALGVVIGGLLS